MFCGTAADIFSPVKRGRIATYIIYIEDITRWREDMNFMFEWQEQYLTSERSEQVRYYSCTREHKIHIFEPTCNVLFIIWRLNKKHKTKA